MINKFFCTQQFRPTCNLQHKVLQLVCLKKKLKRGKNVLPIITSQDLCA